MIFYILGLNHYSSKKKPLDFTILGHMTIIPVAGFFIYCKIIALEAEKLLKRFLD